MIKTNYHTHSLFCDGKNSVEEMVVKAIELQFDILGFSSHSLCSFSTDWHLPVRRHKEYADEVKRIKDLYKDKINIQLGFESDYLYGVNIPRKDAYSDFNIDYLIGAVHYVTNENGSFAVDYSAEQVKKDIENIFYGNKSEVVHAYFENERTMLKKGDFDIIAHPDLIKKHNSKLNLFDENSKSYKEELLLTADAIQKAGVIVEINTGGIARGYIQQPYPSPYFLSLLFERKVPVTFSSDAHSTDHLDFWFTQALDYIQKAGYKEMAYLDSGTIKFQAI